VPRALIATMEPPSLHRAGGGTHAHVFMHQLLSAGWSLTSFNELVGPQDLSEIAAVGQLGVPVYTGRWCAGLGDTYLEHSAELIAGAGFDLALLQSWLLAERYIGLLRTYSPQTRIIVDMGDLFLLRLVRSRLGRGNEGRSLTEVDGVELARELNAYAAADAVLAVSDRERELVDLLCARRGLAFRFPLTRELRDPVPATGRSGLLFVGAFNHPPNVEAVTFLCEKVLPLVPARLRASHPLRVVGFRLERAFAARLARHPHVLPVGWVPDLGPYVDAARIFVAPLLSGAGVKNKFLDAFAAGLPVVTTTLGIEGMGLTPGVNVAVADEPRAIAAEIARLLEDQARWEQLAAGGRRWLESEHPAAGTAGAFWAAVESVLAK
jgi:hypothetical protein